MNRREREGFKQRYGVGVPRSDVDRVMNHYGVDRATAERMMAAHGAEELLPPRGTGLRR